MVSAIIVKQEHHDYHDFCFHSVFKKLTTNKSNCSQMCVEKENLS